MIFKLGIIYFLFLNLISCKETNNSLIKIKINIGGKKIINETKTNCDISLKVKEQNINLKAGIEYRGSSSFTYPKKSYGLKIKKDNESSILVEEIKLKGDFVLYAPYADRTCIRNSLGQLIYQKMGNYSPKSLFTELYINEDYLGLYELREKISLSDDRIKDSKFILKIDKPSEKSKNSTFSLLDTLVKIQLHDKRESDTFNLVFNSILEFEKSLSNGQKNWLKLVDINSFIDYLIITEIANSPDAYRSSCYFRILEDNRIRMGPVWDFDLAFGNSYIMDANNTAGWRFLKSEKKDLIKTNAPPWWGLLFSDDQFRSQLYDRWLFLRKNILSDRSIDVMIDSLSRSIHPAVKQNFKKWPVFNRNIIWTVKGKKSFEEELTYLKSWIKKRNNWIDNELGINY